MANTQKLYCYVDETGQDVGSEFFIVVCVVSSGDQDLIRNELLQIESQCKIHARKWFNTRSPIKEKFLQMVMQKGVVTGGVYYGQFKKPVSFFPSMLEVIEKSIKSSLSKSRYITIVYVDGIDKKKALELTRELRSKGIKLQYVRSTRDESEPTVRLADRWVGCVRNALEGREVNIRMLNRAKRSGYISQI